MSVDYSFTYTTDHNGLALTFRWDGESMIDVYPGKVPFPLAMIPVDTDGGVLAADQVLFEEECDRWLAEDADLTELNPAAEADGRRASRYTERNTQFHRWITELRKQADSGAEKDTPVYVPVSFFDNGFLPSSIGIARHDGFTFISLESALRAVEERDRDIERALVSVRDTVSPELPEAFGTWAAELSYRVRNGARADSEVPVPIDVFISAHRPKHTRVTEKDEVVILLGTALEMLRLDDELHQAREHEQVPTSITLKTLWPRQALTLANTCDAETVAEEFDPDEITALAEKLSAGTWPSGGRPVEVDAHGRITAGLNTLLAIVAADTSGRVSFPAGPGDVPRPLIWRGPAGGLTYNPQE